MTVVVVTDLYIRKDCSLGIRCTWKTVCNCTLKGIWECAFTCSESVFCGKINFISGTVSDKMDKTRSNSQASNLKMRNAARCVLWTGKCMPRCALTLSCDSDITEAFPGKLSEDYMAPKSGLGAAPCTILFLQTLPQAHKVPLQEVVLQCHFLLFFWSSCQCVNRHEPGTASLHCFEGQMELKSNSFV